MYHIVDALPQLLQRHVRDDKTWGRNHQFRWTMTRKADSLSCFQVHNDCESSVFGNNETDTPGTQSFQDTVIQITGFEVDCAPHSTLFTSQGSHALEYNAACVEILVRAFHCSVRAKVLAWGRGLG